MKRFLILLLCIVSLQLPRIFAQEPEEIENVRKNAQAAKDYLVDDQKTLKEMMDRQEEVAKNAPENQRERDKLTDIRNTYESATLQIERLGEYLDKVTNNETITKQDLDRANNDIKNTQILKKYSTELKAEFAPAQTEEQLAQEAQAQIEKLGWWDAFKLDIQTVFAQTKIAIASFFGNKEAEAAARKDLVDIYDQLKDYGNKAKNAGQLSNLYKQLGDFNNAVEAQIVQLDTLDNPNVTSAQKLKIISETIADVFALKDTFLINQLSLKDEDKKTMDEVNTRVNNFLGDLGYKVNEISAYKVLGLASTATDDEIKTRYKNLIMINTPLPDSPEKLQKYKDINNAFAALFGSDINNPDLEIKKAYDKSSIVQQGFEIKKMSPGEKIAFEAKKAEEASKKAQKTTQEQTSIIEGQIGVL